MTHDEAAAILEVSIDASLAEIDRAYRHLARVWHPDLLGDESVQRRAASEAHFVQVTAARELMIRSLAERANPDRADPNSPPGQGSTTNEPHGYAPGGATLPSETRFTGGASSIYGDDGARPVPSTWLFATWAGLLGLACVLTFIGGPLPMSLLDLFLRLLPLVATSCAYALTGRPLYYRGLLLMMFATIVITFVFASFGSLLSLMLILVPVIGLGVLGRRTAQFGPLG